MKILTIVGARPQFIKAAVVSREIQKLQNSGVKISEEIVHTGQHFDNNMSASFFKELSIPKPIVNLNINRGTHGEMTGEMLKHIEAQIQERKPDWVLVYGDTNSTIAGALSAAKLNVKVAHVEAGLRSYNRIMPEEINRVMTDHLSHMLFCPTALSTKNLHKEGIRNNVHLVGDVMYDSFLHTLQKISDSERSAILRKYCVAPNAFTLVTCHRAENTDDTDKMNNIFAALNSLSKRIPVLLPLHPRTRQRLESLGLWHLLNSLSVLPPISYREMMILLQNARLVITDSGGLQKEAFFAETPCVTLRSETEWPETLENDNNRLFEPRNLERESLNAALHHTFVENSGVYGCGNAGSKIVDKLLM